MRRFRLLMLLIYGSLFLSACGGPTEEERSLRETQTAQDMATAVAQALAATQTALALESTLSPTQTPGPLPTATLTPVPPTATPVPISTPCPSDPTVYDDFDCPEFEMDWNEGKWTFYTASGPTFVEQNNGLLTLSRQSPANGGLKHGPLKIGEIGFVEAKLMLDRNIQATIGAVGIGVWFDQASWWLACDVSSVPGSDETWAHCHTSDGHMTSGVQVPYNSWHTMRFEINPETAAISFFVDGTSIGSDYISPNPEDFKQADFTLDLKVWSEDGGLVTGYADDVRIGQFGQL